MKELIRGYDCRQFVSLSVFISAEFLITKLIDDKKDSLFCSHSFI